jgi:hypothetical protein
MVDSEYVMFLDSDDYLNYDTVKIVMEQMRKYDLDILYFDSHIKNEIERTYNNHYDRVGRVKETVMSGIEYFARYYPNSYIVSPCMVVFPENIIYEDLFFSFKAMLNAKKVKYISKKLYVRRYRPNSIMTKTMTYKKCKQLFMSQSLCWSYILELQNTVNEKVLSNFGIYLIKSYLGIKRHMIDVLKSDSEKLKNELTNISLRFLEVWISLNRHVEDFSLSLLRNICTLLQTIDKETEKELYTYFFKGKNNMKEYFWNLYEKRLVEVLNKLPLSITEERVGIFGTGYHTRKLLNWFKYFIDDINCELYFIDTYKETFITKFNGKPVINIHDAGKFVDTIIISSKAYENEMYFTARRLYGDKIKIIRFYEEEVDDILVDCTC